MFLKQPILAGVVGGTVGSNVLAQGTSGPVDGSAPSACSPGESNGDLHGGDSNGNTHVRSRSDATCDRRRRSHPACNVA